MAVSKKLLAVGAVGVIAFSGIVWSGSTIIQNANDKIESDSNLLGRFQAQIEKLINDSADTETGLIEALQEVTRLEGELELANEEILTLETTINSNDTKQFEDYISMVESGKLVNHFASIDLVKTESSTTQINKGIVTNLVFKHDLNSGEWTFNLDNDYIIENIKLIYDGGKVQTTSIKPGRMIRTNYNNTPNLEGLEFEHDGQSYYLKINIK